MRSVMFVGIAFVGCGRVGFDALLDGSDGMATVDGPSLVPPSCVGLASTCGPTGDGPCCGSPLVPAGTYARSFDVASDGMYPDSSFVATVSDFRLDMYEVTVGRFRQFVAAGQATQASPPVAGAGAHPNIAGSGWDATWNGSLVTDTAALVAAIECNATYQTWTDMPGANESVPINCVDWYEAMAFCAWDGGFLPTEAEWNYAAAGGDEQRAYPWSSPPGSLGIDCTYANEFATGACVNAPNGAVNTVGSESPKGDGKWSQSDLGGNVWEWVFDWYASPYPQNPCTECANLTPGTLMRVFRGAGFLNDPTIARTGYRSDGASTFRSFSVGLRCARTP